MTVPTTGGGPPAARRRWPFWVAVLVVPVLLLCATPVVALVVLVDRLPAVGGRVDAGAARSPRPGDPATVTARWLRDRMLEQLDRQAAALLRGDERGFLATAAPESPAVPTLKRQFRSLRAMRVTVWQPVADRPPVRATDSDGGWRLTVTWRHCFQVPACSPGPVTMATRWRDEAGQLRLVAVDPSTGGGTGPRPWEVSDLVAVQGRRVVVATVPAARSRLRGLVAEADRAAEVADRYAVDGTPPPRYRIFYAPAREWQRWYGGGRPDWTAGYAVAVGGDGYDVVLNGADLGGSRPGDLLRHEMTHAATLPPDGYADRDNWWLVEGLAEFAGQGDRPVSRYPTLPEVRRLVTGDWNGRLDGVEPPADAPDWRVGGAYGVGYLAVRHLVDRFGEQRLVTFFKIVVHDGRPVEQAAREAFDEEWTGLHDDCVAYLRQAAGG